MFPHIPISIESVVLTMTISFLPALPLFCINVLAAPSFVQPSTLKPEVENLNTLLQANATSANQSS